MKLAVEFAWASMLGWNGATDHSTCRRRSDGPASAQETTHGLVSKATEPENEAPA